MKRLYIVDLDGTTGLYHLAQLFEGRMMLRPGLKEGLALMGDARRVIATRGDPEYLQAVRQVLISHGIVFDAYYDRETVGLAGDGHRRYLKHYDEILLREEIGPEDQAIVIGDLMHFDKGQPYTMRQYRRFKFSRHPNRPIIKTSCCDHPTDPRLPYVVIPQVFTLKREAVVALSFRAVIEHLERMWHKGGGNWLAGYQRMRRWDWHNEYVVSDALMQKLAFEVQLGQTVETRGGEDISACFRQPGSHHYLFFKGRRRDWLPVDFIQATLEV